jgi:3-methylcrotonyl-CoA carboxylase alpha subunit
MRFVCGGETIEIDVRTAAGGATEVKVGGEAIALSVEEAGPGVFVCRRGDRLETFHSVRDGDVVHLSWDGRTYRLEEETDRTRAAHRHAAGGLEAPMPGKVIAVRVAPGDTVGKGDELLVVEAMKMENAVRAPRDGRVKSVTARVGEMVSPGVVLVELE